MMVLYHFDSCGITPGGLGRWDILHDLLKVQEPGDAGDHGTGPVFVGHHRCKRQRAVS